MSRTSLKSADGKAEMQQNASECSRDKNVEDPLLRNLSMHTELSQRQLNAMPLLLHGLNDGQVAQQLGVDRMTIYRWRRTRAFASELDRQRQKMWKQSLGRLQSLVEPALDILQKQIAGDDPKTALRAAAILLRVASPARLQQLTGPEARRKQAKADADEFMKEVDAYINAPLPGEVGALHGAVLEEEE